MIILSVLILAGGLISLINLYMLGLFTVFYDSPLINRQTLDDAIMLCVISFIWPLFCIIYKSRMMTIVWIIASVVSYKLITKIPDIHKIEIYDYCADVNCDPVECIKTNCW